MNSKIPVWATIAHAYRFAFGNILNNVGVILIPVLAMWLVFFLVMGPYMAAIATMSSGDPRTMLAMFPLFLLLFAVMIGTLAWQMTGLTREALGLRTGNVILQFPAGDILRVIGSWLVYILAVIAVYIATLVVVAIGGMIVGIIAGLAGKAAQIIVIGIAMLALFFANIYAQLRLSFLLTPVAVAEKRVSPLRSWELSKGNFWRMFCILLAIFVPMMLIEFASLFASGFPLIPAIRPGMTADQITAAAHQQQMANLSAMNTMMHFWYLVLPAGLLVGAIFFGAAAGASAFAYRALVPQRSDGVRGTA